MVSFAFVSFLPTLFLPFLRSDLLPPPPRPTPRSTCERTRKALAPLRANSRWRTMRVHTLFLSSHSSLSSLPPCLSPSLPHSHSLPHTLPPSLPHSHSQSLSDTIALTQTHAQTHTHIRSHNQSLSTPVVHSVRGTLSRFLARWVLKRSPRSCSTAVLLPPTRHLVRRRHTHSLSSHLFFHTLLILTVSRSECTLCSHLSLSTTYSSTLFGRLFFHIPLSLCPSPLALSSSIVCVPISVSFMLLFRQPRPPPPPPPVLLGCRLDALPLLLCDLSSWYRYLPPTPCVLLTFPPSPHHRRTSHVASKGARLASMAHRVQYENSNDVGVFATLTNRYVLLANGGSETFYRCVAARRSRARRKRGEEGALTHACARTARSKESWAITCRW